MSHSPLYSPQCPQADKEALARLFAAGRYDDSERMARNMTIAYPGDAFGWKALGAVLQQTGRAADALEPMQKAADLEPGDAAAHNNLGAAFASLERFEEAVASYRTAVALRPDYAEAHNNLGYLLKGLGRMEEAESAYRKAIAANPRLAESYRRLGSLTTYAEDDPRIPYMEQLYRERQLPASDRIHICFALGKACEDLGRINDAFAYYAEGNRLRKQQLGYTLDGDRRLFAVIRSVFSETSSPPSSAAPAEPRPIFIVGMLRSGTSLVEQILSSHSQVFGAGELEAMNLALHDTFNPDGQGYRFHHEADAIARIRGHYRATLERLAPGTPVVTDKMPSNFRWIGFMLEAFPEARIVHLVRDPIATCWSIYKLYFPATGLGFSCDFADLAGYYGLYQELMAFWRERFPGRIYDLIYEQLTENQERETQALLDHCGLPWERQCLDFHRIGRAVQTASAEQVRKPLYQGSSEAWRAFEKHLHPLIEALEPYR